MMAKHRSDGDRTVRKLSRGFTLIEVLVVVAIIALLISILLPSLSRAREQAKITKCLANLSSLGKASVAYLTSERDRFCWGIETSPGVPFTRTWYFGGNRGQDSAQLGTGGFYVRNGDGSVPHDWAPAYRPLNKYVYNSAKLSKTDDRPLRKEGELRVFECPSDRGVRWNSVASSTLKESVSAYIEVGTSFQSNNSWRYYTSNVEEPTPGAARDARILHLMKRIVQILQKKGPARGLLLYEDGADWALNTPGLDYRYKVPTWHNKFDFHSLLFLDGHAAFMYVDWRKNAYSIQKAMTPTWVARQFYKEE